jgi:hypothetical protein
MASVSEDAVQAAMAPGVAKAKSIFDELADRMADSPASDVHEELVKRLQAEPFAWDDSELQKIASTIGRGSSDDSSSDQKPSDDDSSDQQPSES